MAETADAQIPGGACGERSDGGPEESHAPEKLVTAMQNLSEAGVNVLGSVIQEPS